MAMDTIFQLPLAFLACVQILISLLLCTPHAISMQVAKLVKLGQKNVPANTVILTLALVLAFLIAVCFMELVNQGDRTTQADTREIVGTIDYLRAQVSGTLCILNLMLLFLSRALSNALCAEDRTNKNMNAMKSQVKGLQLEYERVTKGSARAPSGPDASGGSNSSAGSGMVLSEAEALKKQVDHLIKEKDTLQNTMEGAIKAKAQAEASVVAMKSQLKGFDQQFDRILEENQLLKRKLVGHGDATYQAEVTRQQTGKKDE